MTKAERAARATAATARAQVEAMERVERDFLAKAPADFLELLRRHRDDVATLPPEDRYGARMRFLAGLHGSDLEAANGLARARFRAWQGVSDQERQEQERKAAEVRAKAAARLAHVRERERRPEVRAMRREAERRRRDEERAAKM